MNADVWGILRLGLGYEPDVVLQRALDKYLDACDLRATATAKQGSAFDFTYSIQLRAQVSQIDLVRELGLTAGVQNVELRRV